MIKNIRWALVCMLLLVFGSSSWAAGPKEPADLAAPLFHGHFLAERGMSRDTGYQLQRGDRVAVRAWGSVTLEGVFVVDGQGNIFLPEIGPLHLLDVPERQLTTVVKAAIGKVFSSNFGVYTNLITPTATTVFVSGFVNKPGRYSGDPGDSLLYYLDKAGGIEDGVGSYRRIQLVRHNKVLAHVDLYNFLLHGKRGNWQFQNGDTIVVPARGPRITLTGQVARSVQLELLHDATQGQQALALMPELARASEVTIQGVRAGKRMIQTMALQDFRTWFMQDGDRITLRAQAHGQDVLIHVKGPIQGAGDYAVAEGTTLSAFLDCLPLDDALVDRQSVYLLRPSVAKAQSKALDERLQRLERSVLLALSSSRGESEIRSREADLTQKFIASARKIQPLGRLVVSEEGQLHDVMLEADDVLVLPQRTQVITINGEVMVPQAVVYKEGQRVRDYVKLAGGYSDRANARRVLLFHPDASVTLASSHTRVGPGDELLITPKVDSKHLQFATDITQIIYQIAVAAKVALGI